MNELEITTLVKNLSRPHPSGGIVIERAAIMAAGRDSPEIIDWIITHAGAPEAPPEARSRGLHGARVSGSAGATSSTPTRFVLPAGTFD